MDNWTTGGQQYKTWVNPNDPYTGVITDEWTNVVSVGDVIAPVIPDALTVCQICGEEDVIVFCEACKEVLKLARKVWAEQILKEIEDDLS